MLLKCGNKSVLADAKLLFLDHRRISENDGEAELVPGYRTAVPFLEKRKVKLIAAYK